MGGMPGVRRDVLQWLVALNLSFPIRNLRRDFSNGFLVAEIFSRYFPTGIQMHSFDTGNSSAKKRNNWSQLEKFFKKKSFHILKEEIENIINCDASEGAGLLLERMYGFLTHKRCTQIQIDATGQDLWLGIPQSSDEPQASNTESFGKGHQHAGAEGCFDSHECYDSYCDDHYDHQESEEADFRRYHSVTQGDDRRGVTFEGNGPKRGDDSRRVDSCPGQVEFRTDLLRRTDVYTQGSTTGTQDCYHDCLPSRLSSGCSDSNPIPGAENILHHRDFVACHLSGEVATALTHSLREAGNCHRQEQRDIGSYSENELHQFGDENANANSGGQSMCYMDDNHLSLVKNKVNCRESSKKVVALSAVERARLKENKRVKKSAKDSMDPRVTAVKEQLWRQEANRSAGLAFRSPNRQRQFKQYTIADWRKQQSMTGHVHLGGLGPKNTDRLDVQKEVYEKVKHFARGVLAANLSKDMEPKEKKVTKLPSSRDKAKEFASKIPKPKVKKVATCQDDVDPDAYASHVPTELEMLENQYHVDKQKFEAMRRDLEHFLR